jgi:putative endonuclease
LPSFELSTPGKTVLPVNPLAAIVEAGGGGYAGQGCILGKSGEQAAAEYLEAHGLRILDRNWRCADGEIDIVAVERHVLVVCEVKSQTSGMRYGSPLEAVSRAKRARLRRLAVQWLNAHGVRFDQVRIDVVGLVYEGTGGFTIEHIRGVG